ncbi:MAG: archease [Verrucomicrobiae bacterium]|nr:archease [Verrucomicrobiae bacterium]MDW7979571.1 archease [Verrucomicrobiales bacterium]
MNEKSENAKACIGAAAGTDSVHRPAEPRWEHFEHKADIGVRGIGPTMAAAFEQAATALVAVCTDPARVRPVEEIRIQCEAPTPELLLIDWLNALIFEMATRKMLFSRFKVQIHGARLEGVAAGEPIDVARHEPAVEVKGATYAELAVHEARPGHWVAQCVVDV